MTHDALILGGGPAGLSAAIYLARFNRRVLVLDAGKGRSSFSQCNQNYLGFPDGVTTRELRELGKKQAENFGALFKDCQVERIECLPDGTFRAYTTEGDFDGRTLLFATGVTDIWPNIPGIYDWIGEQVFWCITCDGFRTVGKRIVCIGNDDEAATTTLQFLLFTDQITLVADPELARFSDEKRDALAAHCIALVLARPDRLDISDDSKQIDALCLSDGASLPCDMIFSLLGVRPNTGLARDMGLALDHEAYVVMDEEGYTSIPGVFAAGDLTRMYTQQVASAVHAGAEAAQTMNYYLYPKFQRNTDAPPPAATSVAPEAIADAEANDVSDADTAATAT